MEEPQLSDRHPELVHHANFKALEGILKTGRLWATRAQFLNDSSEMKLMRAKSSPYVRNLIITALADPGRGSNRQNAI